MSDSPPPLKPLHGVEALSTAKLAIFDRMSTEALRQTFTPGQAHCLKARQDGTMLDGHHRIHILRSRNEPVDSLPRETCRRPSRGISRQNIHFMPVATHVQVEPASPLAASNNV